MILLSLSLLGCLGLLASCQSRLIYFPRPYGPDVVAKWAAEPGTTVVDYQTAEGRQQAYLFSPAAQPERLWIVCGGNGTLALDWADWLREHAPAEDAWLMVDMPGYGACSGKPSPATIRRSLKAVVPAAMGSLHWSLPQDQAKLRFFGHSLGSAVCLMAADEYHLQRGVLLAPFTSTMDMTREVIGVPLGFLIWHRFDNRARLKEIAGRGPGEVFILHGSQDEVIPVRMSRELAQTVPSVVRYREIDGGRHNTLQDVAAKEIVEALREARR